MKVLCLPFALMTSGQENWVLEQGKGWRATSTLYSFVLFWILPRGYITSSVYPLPYNKGFGREIASYLFNLANQKRCIFPCLAISVAEEFLLSNVCWGPVGQGRDLRWNGSSRRGLGYVHVSRALEGRVQSVPSLTEAAGQCNPVTYSH